MSARSERLLALIAQAADSNIGYDQGQRWSYLDKANRKIIPNREADCSSMVIGLIWLAGYPVPTANIGGTLSCYTGNEYDLLVNHAGLKPVNVKGRGNAAINALAKPGDALVALEGHTLIKAANGKWFQMSIDERGRASGGQAGDQTGHESNYSDLYTYHGDSWDWLFVLPDRGVNDSASTPSTPTTPSTPSTPTTTAASGDPDAALTLDDSTAGILTTNPVDELNVTTGFARALTRSAHRVSRASLWLGSRCLIRELPLTADQSKISVASSAPVRRQASLQFDSGFGFKALRDALEYPGVTIQVETGFDLGGATEMVPVFESSAGFIVTSDDATQTIKVDAPDRMEMVSKYGIETQFSSNPDATFIGMINAVLTEACPGARLVDLTGNAENMPELFFDVSATGRIDMCMQFAAAIGAEFFKSPAPGVWVIRPVVAPGHGKARWVVEAGRELISTSRAINKEKIVNVVTVECERADASAARGTWIDTDPNSVTRYDGPMGRRLYEPLRTSLWSTPSDLGAYATAIGARLKGAPISIDWSMLVNPLMEPGDSVEIRTTDFTYEVILDSFEIPLGSQRVSPGTARALSIPGGNAS